MINGYDFPEISYFLQGNDFTGSQGECRYKISKQDDELKVYCWFEDVCFECAENPEVECFEVSNDGLVKAIEWILSKKK